MTGILFIPLPHSRWRRLQRKRTFTHRWRIGKWRAPLAAAVSILFARTFYKCGTSIFKILRLSLDIKRREAAVSDREVDSQDWGATKGGIRRWKRKKNPVRTHSEGVIVASPSSWNEYLLDNHTTSLSLCFPLRRQRLRSTVKAISRQSSSRLPLSCKYPTLPFKIDATPCLLLSQSSTLERV
ncbi:hypothetical protein R3P38DRAFT_3231441 [Favolaschia claudopus]|uniref:Uncharacterized protein n=1 Tax=Favolaschia claudopus TaxID=2862362 RepID=A0AAV9ZKH5_9AGAR